MDNKLIHYISYLTTGFITAILSLGSYYLLIYFNFQYMIANIVSIVVGVLSAFIMNDLYVFKNSNISFFVRFSRFMLSRVFTTLFDIFFMYLFIEILKGDKYITKIIDVVIIVILNYILSKFFVFKKEVKE